MPALASSPPVRAASQWRPRRAQLGQLLLGLLVLGIGEGLMAAAALGNNPWVVLAQGVAEHSLLGIGSATVAFSALVLLLWIPLRQRPGLGTVLNAALIGTVLALVLAAVPTPHLLPARAAYLLSGIALIAVGSGLYIGAQLGTGPRDGLMTGLHVRTGRSIRLVRTLIEAAVVTAGWLLGGTVGVGTIAFVLLIGPSVQAVLAVIGWQPAPGAQVTTVHGSTRELVTSPAAP